MAKVNPSDPFKVYSGEKVLAVLNIESRPTQKGAPAINLSCVVVEDRAATVPTDSRGNAGMLIFENYMLSGPALFKLEQLFGAAKLPAGKDTEDADFVDWLRDRLTADGIYLVAQVGEEAKWNDPTKMVAKIQRLRGLAFPEFTPEMALTYMAACDKAKEANPESPSLPAAPKAIAESKAKKWPDIVNKALEKMEERARSGGRGGAGGGGYSGGSGSSGGGSSNTGNSSRSRSEDPMAGDGGGGSMDDDGIPF